MASGAQTHANGQPREQRKSLGQSAPVWLRPARALAGLAVLVMAWGATLLAALLALYTLHTAPQRQLALRVALYIAGGLGTLWLGVMALSCLIVGSFCLMLALTSRRW
jgi:hypothetical protein